MELRARWGRGVRSMSRAPGRGQLRAVGARHPAYYLRFFFTAEELVPLAANLQCPQTGHFAQCHRRSLRPLRSGTHGTWRCVVEQTAQLCIRHDLPDYPGVARQVTPAKEISSSPKYPQM